MAALLKRGLQEDGYVVDIAATGTDAVWQAGEFDYDVVVLDLMLPGLDGVEVCRQLSKIGRWGLCEQGCTAKSRNGHSSR